MGTGLTWQTESWTSLSFFLLVPNSSNIINIHVELNFILFITRVGDPDPNFEKARIRTLNFIQKKLERFVEVISKRNTVSNILTLFND